MFWFKKNIFKKISISNPIWEEIIIGKIISSEKHPNADRLKLCVVDCGSGVQRNIVCGGSNVKNGMLVAVAKPGVKVVLGGNEEVELKETKIRGVVSQGMLCGAEEIGLEEQFPPTQEKEIVDLSSTSGKVGEKLSSIL